MTTDEVEEHSSAEEIRREIERLEALKLERAGIEAEIADIEKYLDKALDKDFRYKDEAKNESVVATVVRGTLDRFDEHLISTRYKRVYTAITKRSIDKTLYLEAVRTGLITPEMHAKFHHTVPKKSYVKITHYFNGNAIEASE